MGISRKKAKRGKSKWTRHQSSRMANHADVQRALTHHAAEILDMIPLDKVQLSQPIGRDKACICVSVEPGEERKVPDLIVIKIGRKIVSIPIEVLDEYAKFEIQ